MASSHPARRSCRPQRSWGQRLLFRWGASLLLASALSGCVAFGEHAALQARHDALRQEHEALTELNAAQHRIIVAQERELQRRDAEGKPAPAPGD